MATDQYKLFTLAASRDFAARVAAGLDRPLARHEERDFEDGEHKARPLESVREQDCFVVTSLYSDEAQSVNDKLCRLLFFCGALRESGAARVTAVVPYLAYARKDRQTKPRDPVTTRYVAQLFEAVGVGRVVTMDAHNLAAFQNAFRCATEHLEARTLFVDYFGSLLQDEEVAVLSPDAGGIKRAEQLRQDLAEHWGRPVASAFMEKQRSGGVVSGEQIVGQVANRSVLIVDDLIATGTTLQRAAWACRQAGANAVYAAATHGVFTGQADAVLADETLARVVVTDTLPPFRLPSALVTAKVEILDASRLCAQAIRRLTGQTDGAKA